jgi:hypothetical protein
MLKTIQYYYFQKKPLVLVLMVALILILVTTLIVNSPNIYLGLKDGNLPTEPVILGHRLQEWMVGSDLTEGLLDVLDDILDMILSDISYIAPPQGPTTPNAANISVIDNRRRKLDRLKKQFKENLSNQVKTI